MGRPPLDVYPKTCSKSLIFWVGPPWMCTQRPVQSHSYFGLAPLGCVPKDLFKVTHILGWPPLDVYPKTCSKVTHILGWPPLDVYPKTCSKSLIFWVGPPLDVYPKACSKSLIYWVGPLWMYTPKDLFKVSYTLSRLGYVLKDLSKSVS